MLPTFLLPILLRITFLAMWPHRRARRGATGFYQFAHSPSLEMFLYIPVSISFDGSSTYNEEEGNISLWTYTASHPDNHYFLYIPVSLSFNGSSTYNEEEGNISLWTYTASHPDNHYSENFKLHSCFWSFLIFFLYYFHTFYSITILFIFTPLLHNIPFPLPVCSICLALLIL